MGGALVSRTTPGNAHVSLRIPKFDVLVIQKEYKILELQILQHYYDVVSSYDF